MKKPLLALSIGILLISMILFFIFNFTRKPPTPQAKPEETSESKEDFCFKTGFEGEMSLAEAKEIARQSECVEEGELAEEYFCNENTGTWWLDLEIEKEGCAPACVVDIITKEAEINWRCTGLIPE